MRAETLERRLSKMRQMYFEGLERRVSDYNTKGYTDDKAFTKWEGKMQRDLDDLRKELAQVKPEKWHFGRKNKSFVEGVSEEHSRQGDNGYVLCERCRGLFLWDYKVKHMRFRENYSECSEHEGMKSIGVVRVRDVGEHRTYALSIPAKIRTAYGL